MTQQVAVEVSGIDFAAAHFVSEGGKCERLHGHNYQVAAFIWGNLNSLGMVLDFREIKRRLKAVCNKWDHHILLPTGSSLIKVNQKGDQVEVDTPNGRYSFPKKDVKILDVVETTAEELVRILCEHLVEDLKRDYTNISKVRITLSESPTSRATVTLPV
jgi:6-pyruvoyltetrahydropterin/6-carboxytetrahydropterin synthase